jgi:integrase
MDLDAIECREPNGPGRPVRPAAAGLPRVRFHALRHAFATTLLADGEDIANVSKLLGHRDLATTANVYGHLTDQASRRAADRMDKALRRAR